MALVRAGVYDGGQMRMPLPGDLIANSEAISTNATAGNLAITGAMMATGILSRSGSGSNYADSFPTADDLLAALLAYNYQGLGANTPLGLPPNMAFRFRLINTVAFTDTPTAPDTSVVLGSNTGIAASSVKEYLITLLAMSPAKVYSGTTTNANAVVTGIADTSYLIPGMLVTGTGIQANTTILGVAGPNSVTLSQNANASGTNALTFRPRYRVDSLGQMLL